ncbi:MAG: hypothetical protein JWQ74_1072, partial [Marmoricola sp.]|nr:hypothetical protein [Marmoricola sp.]
LGGADDNAPPAPAPAGLIHIADLILSLAPTWPVVVLLLIAIVTGSAGNFAAL